MFKAYYKKCYKNILDIIDLIYDLGRTNLFVTINNDELKEAWRRIKESMIPCKRQACGHQSYLIVQSTISLRLLQKVYFM